MNKKIIHQLKETPFFEKATVLKEFIHEEDNSAISRFIAVSTEKHNLNGFYQSPIGTIFHFKNNFPHNEDGPALEYKNGKKEWWLDGIQISEEDFIKWQIENNKHPIQKLHQPKNKKRTKI